MERLVSEQNNGYRSVDYLSLINRKQGRAVCLLAAQVDFS
jgi:hypothetical protein